MRARHLLMLLLALPLAGCGGCSCSSDPRNAAPNPDEVGEPKPPVELYVRLQAATKLPKRGELPPELLAALQDDSPHVRRAAVFTVRRSGADGKAISEALTPLLKDRDLFLRVVAAEVLWEVEKNPDAVTALKTGMRDDNLHVRTRAIRALGDVGPEAKDIAPELTAMLAKSNRAMQQVIAETLARIHFADVPALAQAMVLAQMDWTKNNDDATKQAWQAMFKALQSLGKDGAPPLMAMMKKTDDPFQQKIAALAVEALGPDGAATVPALIGLLKVRTHKTHQTAIDMLGLLGPAAEPAVLHLMELLDDEDPETAQGAANALGRIGKAALPPLLIRLRSKKAKNDLAIYALAKLGKDAVPSLLDLLKSEDQTNRLRAALALGEMASPPKEAWPDLFALLKEWTENAEGEAFCGAGGLSALAARRRESSTAFRLVAATAHFGDGAAPAVPILKPLLKDRSYRLRLVTARALAAIGPEARSAIPALGEMLSDADERNVPAAQQAAAAALIALRPNRKADVPILIEIVKSRLDLRTREKAIDLLGQIGPDAVTAVPAMMELVNEGPGLRAIPNTSTVVSVAVGRIGEKALPDVVKAVQMPQFWGEHKAEGLARLGKPGRDVLLRWLKDDDKNLREIAATILGSVPPDDQVTAALLDAVKDPDLHVREHALVSLPSGRDSAARVVPALIAALHDPNNWVSNGALYKLACCKASAKAAIPALIEILNDDDKSTRRSAAGALVEIGPGASDIVALKALLKEKRPPLREVALVLGSMKVEAPETASRLRELRADSRLEEDAEFALWHVAQDSDSLLRFLNRLHSPDARTRLETVWQLGAKSAGAAVVIPALSDALYDSDEQVRKNAAYAMGEFGPAAEPLIPDLLAWLQRNDSDQSAVLWILNQMGPAAREAVPALKQFAKNATPELQLRAQAVLVHIANDKEALAALSDMVADEKLCWRATLELSQLGAAAKGAIPALRAQLANPKHAGDAIADIERTLRDLEAQ